MSGILGIDYGEKRLGVASSDPLCVISMPLCTIEVQSVKQAIGELCEICRENDIRKIVIGLPLNMDGTRGPMAAKVKAFAGKLGKAANKPIETWDERLSTSQAERALVGADMSRRKRKLVRDKIAAQIILQSYLDARDHRAGSNFGAQ